MAGVKEETSGCGSIGTGRGAGVLAGALRLLVASGGAGVDDTADASAQPGRSVVSIATQSMRTKDFFIAFRLLLSKNVFTAVPHRVQHTIFDKN